MEYRPRGERYYQLDFYISERRRRNVLLNTDGSPVGGHWSFDAENRRALPRSVVPPRLVADVAENSATVAEAKEYISRIYPDNPGNTEMQWEGGVSTYFPTTLKGATAWLDKFFDARFAEFGPYQDAIIPTENLLFHSAISPMLNIGLLEPVQVLSQAVERGHATGVPMSSIEGFVRQILGWREYVRMTYAQAGRRMRTSNHFNFPARPLPQAFSDGTTGIPPVDNVIRKVLRVGWCHHIERLMVIGNFMLLCEVHPDEVYRWFSALFHDAYDWVMVPNVYGMSQFADGGLLATKPYISGSAYLMKMGRYEKGLWQGVWDALYWRFLLVHEEALHELRRSEAMPDAKVVLDPARRKLVMGLSDDFLEKLWG